MSKFNTRSARPAAGRGPVAAQPTPSGRTHEGGAGYAHDAKSELFLLAVANFVGENAFYEKAADRDRRYADLVPSVAVNDPQWTGRLLQSNRSDTEKMRIIAISAVSCLALGLMIHPWNPIIKRICTTSFTLYSTGWVLLMLLAFYWFVEVKGYRKWTFPLIVIGANSIFIYSVHQVLQRWLDRAQGRVGALPREGSSRQKTTKSDGARRRSIAAIRPASRETASPRGRTNGS